ncbi:BTB/POZ domain-containing protein 17 [Neocloeon triangulifer]|uniref:BTB/POZ domain-containing protein 17 n=1 Tax=Neocloeon triangulifer TaxID=2078957 RepID=UPI00286ECE6B|nr:BTB/POZ domain-containing protein 17 [Neocloeon triangulifer]XP_059486730.1 BTB/POZ domain-containing protein 17 [Neocloeon triangulifer]
MDYFTSGLQRQANFQISDCSQNFLQRISNLCGSYEMSDVTLVVGGTEYPAHRLLLCLSSEVFRVMLMNKEWNEAQERKVVLQESTQCCKHFHKFLAFFYRGKICISVDDCLPILCLADKYNVKELSATCLEYMCLHIAYAATNSILLSWMQYTNCCGHTAAAQACQNFVLWNFSTVARADDFCYLELESIISILQQNDLVVKDELELYRLVIYWLELQKLRLAESDLDTEETLASYTQATMKCIRFPMMTPRQLADLLLQNEVKKYKEFFVDRLALGMAFHSDEKQQLAKLMEGESELMLVPRIYTADTWSSVVVIEKYSDIQSYHTSTLVFSIPASFSECNQSSHIEWVVDFYPRGLWYPKGLLITWEGTKEVPEAVLKTCRLSITCRDPETLERNHFHAKIGVLVSGMSAGIEHVANVVYKHHYFDRGNSVLHLDDVLPYEKLLRSKFLVGEHLDTLKLRIVIQPLDDVVR